MFSKRIIPIITLIVVMVLGGCTSFSKQAEPKELTFGAFYYPWYGLSAHLVSESLRGNLNPKQMPESGNYDSRDETILSNHIAMSSLAGISLWVCSWWGPGSYEDITIKEHILRHPDSDQLSYAVLYETTGRCGSMENPDFSYLLQDIQYLNNTIFKDPKYYKVDDKPVLFIYLTRGYFHSEEGRAAIADVRKQFPDLYLIGDDVFGPGYSSSQAAQWDAVMAYDVYGQSFSPFGANKRAIRELEEIYGSAKLAARRVDTIFIPTITPGFNDSFIRPGEHSPIPRYLENSARTKETNLLALQIEKAAMPHVSQKLQNLILITSFNEWHEDTQIEPTAGKTDSTQEPATLTETLQYDDYGDLYLEILGEYAPTTK